MTPIAAAAAWGAFLACTPVPGSGDVSPPAPAPVTPDSPPVTGDTGDGGDTDVPVVTEPLYWVAADNGAAVWSCGLVSDGTVRCWGTADYAEEPSRTETFTQISVGGYQACGLVLDGSVRCWGIDLPEFYDGTDILREVPVGGVYTRVDVGHGTACAQDAAGALTCWGDDVLLADAPLPPEGPVLDFDLESNSNGGLLPDGSLTWWGYGLQWGEPEPDVVLTQVAWGRRHACGLDAAGAAWCWGEALDLAQFPDPPAGVFTTIEAWNGVTCVLDAAGWPTCWWGADWEALNVWADTLPKVPLAQMGLGEWDGCGVDFAGQAHCWGGDPADEPWLRVPELNP